MLSTSSARIDEPGDYRTLTNAPHAAAKPAATSRYELNSVQPVKKTLSQLTFSLHQFLAGRR